MNVFKKSLILFLICMLCDIITFVLPFSFPSSVLAMIVMFFCLFWGIFKVRQVEPVAGWLTKNMAFIFTPITVSIIGYADLLGPIIWKFIFICLVSAFITLTLTASSVNLTMKLLRKRRGADSNA